MKQSAFDARISALDAETSALGAATPAIAWRSFDARYRRSMQRRRRSRGVTGDCGVGVTPQMCNRVTNHGDMGSFSRPDSRHLFNTNMCLINFHSKNIKMCFPKVEFLKFQTRFKHSLSIVLR